MDENLSRGYLLLQRPNDVSDPDGRSNHHQIANSASTSNRPPTDSFQLIYLSLVLAGVGFLLPYNSFVIAVDYFQLRYPGTTIVFDISTIYIVTAFVSVVINNLLVGVIPLIWRINFGYGLSFLSLLFVAIFEIGAQIDGYLLNLVAVSIVSVGCTIQQSSFYGYTSMLPLRYTQAVMTGESAAGLIISINRIVTKIMLPEDQRRNTLLFFGLSITMIVVCGVIHGVVLPRTDFIRFYMKVCQSNHRLFSVTSSNGHDREDVSDGRFSQMSVRFRNKPNQAPVKQISVISRSDSTDFVLPFGIDDDELAEVDCNQTFDDDADKEIPLDDSQSQVSDVADHFDGSFLKFAPSKLTSMRVNLKKFQDSTSNWCVSRYKVAKLIWPYMISICIAYTVTVALFPGIESEIVSCSLGSWMPVILMFIFNLSDFLGKILASLFYSIDTKYLTTATVLRVIFIPLLAFCAAPRRNPLLSGHSPAFFLSAALGLTNGICGSLPMILAPMKVPDNVKEMSGNVMTLSYSVGLTIGSALSYAIEWTLGPNDNGICS